MQMSRLEIDVNRGMGVLKETTSKGDQTKWAVGDYFVKQNKLGYEDIAEWTTSYILNRSSLHQSDFVSYGLASIRDRETNTLLRGCYSKNFVPRGFELITIYRIYEMFGLEYKVKGVSVTDRVKGLIDNMFKVTDLDITNYLRCILTLDAFILNEDRHFNNLALLYKEGYGFKPAPIFDNGLSMLSDLTEYKSTTPLKVNIQRVKSKTFSTDFTKQLDVLGVGFQIDGTGLNNYLEHHKHILGRVYYVIKHQMDLFEGSIVV